MSKAFEKWGADEYGDHWKTLDRNDVACMKQGWQAALAHASGKCDQLAFLCHIHDDYGKGRERGMLDCAEELKREADRL